MAFTLEVSFTGLCLFLLKEDCTRVAVVQPDCRANGLPPQHPDGDPEPGAPHVGYLRYDLASLGGGFSPGTDPVSGPHYEVVHRFVRETLDFGLSSVDAPMTIDTKLPAMERIAPAAVYGQLLPENECGHGEKSLLKPIEGLLSGNNPPLVMRTVFSGGDLDGGNTSDFEFLRAFNPGGAARYRGRFARKVIWTREVTDADHLTLTLTRFDGTPTQKITLKPVKDMGGNDVIVLKIGNLCADNPLEWPELGKAEAADIDRDFKWLYRLLETTDGRAAQTLLPADTRFPVPIRPANAGLGGENCIGTRITVTTL
ncbi:MAG TPA: hypothetical protein VF647_02630 [Longimicrobium sp.]|jgi:hypothetical protein